MQLAAGAVDEAFPRDRVAPSNGPTGKTGTDRPTSPKPPEGTHPRHLRRPLRLSRCTIVTATPSPTVHSAGRSGTPQMVSRVAIMSGPPSGAKAT
jgi:hypothetical protein